MLKDDNLLGAFHRLSPKSNNDVPGDVVISIESQIPARYKDDAEEEGDEKEVQGRGQLETLMMMMILMKET